MRNLAPLLTLTLIGCSAGPDRVDLPSPRLQDGKAVVSPNVQVFGSLGEEYYDFQPKGKVPTFELYDANTGKRLQKGKFPAG